MPARHSPHSLLKTVHAAKAVSAFVTNARRARCVAPNCAQGAPVAHPKRFITTPTTSVSTPTDVLKKSSYADLEEALRNDSDTVWKAYNNLLNSSEFPNLPLEVHQEVLRKCTVSKQEARTHSVLRRMNGKKFPTRHRHEQRFQTIIGNIRGAGHTPSLDDYHFVLSQFAAVGHVPSSMQVYEELRSVGHVPTSRTFGYILQAIAHRLTLPINRASRDEILAQVNVIFNGLLKDMKEFNIPTVQANIDLSFRILKESMSPQAFDRFMRWAYGIDMSYPDRPPLDSAKQGSTSDTQGLPVPFSTHALNTAIDYLGRRGDLSKMVQTFEVLTQPLPHAQEHFFSSFEDDEDDIGAVLPSSQLKSKQPSAQANTATYTLLIRHSARASHRTLARHYLNEAIHLNRDIALSLRETMYTDDPDITQPRFSLRKDHFVPVLALGTRYQDSSMLLEWLQRKVPKQLKKKQHEVNWHMDRQKFRAKVSENARASSLANPPPLPDAPTSTSSTTSDRVDLDFDTSTSSPPHSKPFDTALHLRILERDVEEFTQLSEQVAWLSGRAHQRKKEKLGRRIWEGKDVFLMHKGRRGEISKLKWMHIMNFKPMKTHTEGQPEDVVDDRERQRQISEEREALERRRKQRMLEEQRDGFFTSSAVGKELKALEEMETRTSLPPRGEGNKPEPGSSS